MSTVQQNMAQQVSNNSKQMAYNNSASACFTYFNQLPKELRLQVWELCLPKRIVKRKYFRHEDYPGDSTDISLAPPPHPPLISRVNREARRVALAFGSIAEIKVGYGREDIAKVWKDTSTDLVHNNMYPFRGFQRAHSCDFLSWAMDCSHNDADGGKQVITFPGDLRRITLRLTHEEIMGCELFGVFGEVRSILVQQGDQKRITQVAQLVDKSAMHLREMMDAFRMLHFPNAKSQLFRVSVAWLWQHGYTFPACGDDDYSLADVEELGYLLDHWLPTFDPEEPDAKELLGRMPEIVLAVEPQSEQCKVQEQDSSNAAAAATNAVLIQFLEQYSGPGKSPSMLPAVPDLKEFPELIDTKTKGDLATSGSNAMLGDFWDGS